MSGTNASEKGLPTNVDAERFVLGSILLDDALYVQAAGTLEAEDAQLLEEAFELIFGLRVAHQVEQLKAGEEPDDFLDPAALSPLTRGSLKEAFRAVAGVQRRIANELRLGVR